MTETRLDHLGNRVLRGNQRPRKLHLPAYDTDYSGEQAMEFVRYVGLKLDPWQEFVLRESLNEVRNDGWKWAAFEVALICPRQNGKNEILMARELVGLYVLGEELILHSAHEFKAAAEAFRRVLDIIRNHPGLWAKVKKIRVSSGQEGIELKNGRRLRFVARSTGSGRGFTADTIILDEAFNLSPDKVAALLPTMSGRANPQLWYASSAGMEDSDHLRDVRERADSSTGEMAFFEWSAKEDANLDDPAVWAEANPALGIRIDERFIRHEREVMPEIEFARERLGIWSKPTGTVAVDMNLWSRLTDKASFIESPFMLAVDVAPEREYAAIGVASKRDTGVIDIEVAVEGPGTAWLVSRVIKIVRERHPIGVMIDINGPAGALAPALGAALVAEGMELTTVTQREAAQAAGMLADAVKNGQVCHRDQVPLNVALGGARRRAVGDGLWAWARKSTKVNISPLVAVTLAMFGLVAHRPDPETEEPELMVEWV